jgi:hypothetical protein
MTPPSTFQMALVTQLVAGESRKLMGVGQVARGADPRVQSGLGRRVGRRRGGGDCLLGPHAADFDD